MMHIALTYPPALWFKFFSKIDTTVAPFNFYIHKTARVGWWNSASSEENFFSVYVKFSAIFIYQFINPFKSFDESWSWYVKRRGFP